MRQQDYKMVQGVNQVVNMNPNIAASGGNAMARLGQQLAQTGQDVSAMMEATAKADDETKLIRQQQMWKEAHNKQLVFQDENPNDPLDWQTHRAKMLPNIEAENNAIKFNTKWGRTNSTLAYEKWRSDTGMEIDRMSHGKIWRNRAEVGIVATQNSLEEKDIAGAQNSFDLVKDNLSPDVANKLQQEIDDTKKELVWNDGVDIVDGDASRAVKEHEEQTGYAWTNFPGEEGREDREKYLKYAKTAQKVQASEQMDALDLARLENPSFGSADLKELIVRGGLNQLTPLEVAKVEAAAVRVDPPTGSEMVSIFNLMKGLKAAKRELSKDDYIKHYHNTSLMIRGMIPNKGYGYVFEDLKALSPSAKGGRTGSAENKRSNREEVTALISGAQRVGDYDNRPEGGKLFYSHPVTGMREYDHGKMSESQRNEQGMKMRDHADQLNEWIENSDEPLTRTDIRQKFGIVIAGGKIINALETQALPKEALWGSLPSSWEAQPAVNENTWGEGMPKEQQSPASDRPKQTGEFAKEKEKKKLPISTGSVDRSTIKYQIDANPDTKRLLFASAAAEVGSQGDDAIQAYMETVTNRALATGKSLRSVLLDDRYYPDPTKRKLSRKDVPDYSDQWLAVSNGSNITNFATDNASANLAKKRVAAGNPYIRIGGELFYVNVNGNGEGGMPSHARWLKNNQAQ